MKPEFKFNLSSPPPSEEEIVAARKSLLADMRFVSRRQLGFFAAASAFFLAAVLFMAPWSGSAPGYLSVQLSVCLYIVFAISLFELSETYEIGISHIGIGSFVSFLTIMIVFLATVGPLAVFLKYSFMKEANLYSGLGFLALDVIVFVAAWVYSQRLGDLSYDASRALAGLDPIALEHCPEALAWRNEHPEIANYQAQAAAQGRMLMEGEYFAMGKLVQRLNDEKAAREHMAELEKSCELLRLPAATAAV